MIKYIIRTGNVIGDGRYVTKSSTTSFQQFARRFNIRSDAARDTKRYSLYWRNENGGCRIVRLVRKMRSGRYVIRLGDIVGYGDYVGVCYASTGSQRKALEWTRDAAHGIVEYRKSIGVICRVVRLIRRKNDVPNG